MKTCSFLSPVTCHLSLENMSTTAPSFMTEPREGERRDGEPTGDGAATAHAKVSVRGLNFFYGNTQALFDITLDVVITPSRPTTNGTRWPGRPRSF